MRPRTLAEYVGQGHLLGTGRLLGRIFASAGTSTGTSANPGGGGRRALALPSLILWGPPGTGKTTLARLLAQAVTARFVAVSAVQAGVKELRLEIDEARARLTTYGERTILFVDEIHRFNKSQQDALLPHVEAGTVTLLGATTENPSFEVNAALLSRCRVVQLKPLTEEDLRALLDRALVDEARGLGGHELDVPAPVRALIAREAGGDARRALATLEAAAPVAEVSEGLRRVDVAAVEQALQRKVLLYDKGGEEHYGVVSAFIKSLRGSDVDAAVYWMVRMLEAGEDPLFVLRRMVIFAAEDIGVADPQALPLAMATVDAVRFVGLPEGTLPMTELAIYLAAAPKTNTALTTYGAARKLVLQRGALPVPLHLRNASSSTGRELGYGVGYQYPHNFSGNYVPQRYLPEEIQGARLYQPSRSGHEAALGARLAALAAAESGVGAPDEPAAQREAAADKGASRG